MDHNIFDVARAGMGKAIMADQMVEAARLLLLPRVSPAADERARQAIQDLCTEVSALDIELDDVVTASDVDTEATSSTPSGPVEKQKMCASYLTGPLFPATEVYELFNTVMGIPMPRRREYALFFEGADGDSYVNRRETYSTASEFTGRLDKKTKDSLVGIHIGGMYLNRLAPSVKTDGPIVMETSLATTNTLIFREFAFDIDLDKYDGIRSCGCKAAAYCRSCFWLAPLAVAFLADRLIAMKLGQPFINYSGNRGCHERVFPTAEDGSARMSLSLGMMDKQQRARVFAAMVPDYLNRGELTRRLVRDPDLYSAVSRLIIELPPTLRKAGANQGGNPTFFKRYCPVHAKALIATFKDVVATASIHPTTGLMDAFRAAEAEAASLGNSELAETVEYQYFINRCAVAMGKATILTCAEGDAGIIITTALTTLLPRCDKEIFDPTHLLGAPMRVHPSSGNVACPIKLADLLDFYPADHAPTIQLSKERALTLKDSAIYQAARRNFTELVQHITKPPPI